MYTYVILNVHPVLRTLIEVFFIVCSGKPHYNVSLRSLNYWSNQPFIKLIFFLYKPSFLLFDRAPDEIKQSRNGRNVLPAFGGRTHRK